ncbi:hypothetical protein BCR41DRAFT_54260 [Lobosporangium transversale]|uniref:Uncharacterized protein n=1 Tax=Lobosporangium transversale TaxID=64571 RepID=A0A1Y2GNG4_9FUNG|nr:hypothetical protein BCR41DRAFT_54260 [Lobosporangium transversale]ORZ16722.1 hypothetical protein BCR41DRAFT_54260 [Lobosporangium transversale]|eukprot:XP_021881657.1 hypothetical protein BCR41DRAFT_54260 [Lobosporangium transversale]
MRSSLLFAVASVFVASATAHDGHPHDPPATAPSGCLATPTDAVCSTFVVPNATITDAIKEICAINSFLPGCSLNAACTADSKLSTTYCAPMTILASLCIPTEDAVLTGTVCSKSYSIFCAANSLIPACKGQPAFPGLPSGKTVTGTVYSICQEMPMMTDCKICPTPEASGYSNCDEVKAWKGLCLDMPDMKQCPSYNTMCSNTKFAPFCDLNSNKYTHLDGNERK